MPKVLIARQIPPPAAERLRAAGHTVDEPDGPDPLPRAELLERITRCDAVITTISERVDVEFLAVAGPQLKIVANCAVGYDNIDLAACRARNISVTNTPGVLTAATADMTFALILATARRVVEGDHLVRSGRWHGWGPGQLLGLELEESVLGVIGAGRIGTAVAQRAFGFGLNVVYAHPRPNAELDARGARQVELQVLFRTADIVTLHVPMRPQNYHLLGADELAAMKPQAILINTARGPLVDELALRDALREQRIAAAGLDVYENEPDLTPGLSDLPNVVLLPHLGSATHRTRQRMSAIAAENVVAALSGRAPPNLIL